MAITLNDNLQIQANKNIDNRYGPYNSISAALAALPSFQRSIGLTIGIIQANSLKEYWFRDGVADVNLIEKSNTIIAKTYTELKELREASQLQPGQFYKITDFQTMWRDQVDSTISGVTNLTSPVIEPLTILAISTNKFSTIAYSELYPSDIIYYDFEATYNRGMLYGSVITGYKGSITRRIDTVKVIDMSHDWRHITVNCARPDLQYVSEWNPTVTYNAYDVVKLNNKLFYSGVSNNLNLSPTLSGAEGWRSFTGYNEGLTYFSTNDKVLLRAYKPDGTSMLTLSADLNTKIQKYIFDGAGPEDVSSGSNYMNDKSNIFIEGFSFSNIFLGATNNIKAGKDFRNNTIGAEFNDNVIGGGFSYNIISKYCYNNKFGEDFSQNITNSGPVQAGDRMIGNTFSFTTFGNIFGRRTQSNTFGENVSYNLFGTGLFEFNIIDTEFRNNNLSRTFRRNRVGSTFYENDLSGSANMYDNVIMGNFYRNTISKGSGAFFTNVIGPTFRNNVMTYDATGIRNNNIQGNCFSNTINGSFTFNNIGTSFNSNTVGSAFIYNTVAGSMAANTIGTTFAYNNIGESFRSNTIGNNFRYNVVEPYALDQYGSLTTATHIYNTYNTRIFKNSSNVARLSYCNSSDQLVVVQVNA